MPIAIILAVAVLVTGGASVAAEGAAPGDVLYAIKTGVNEPIRGALTVGAEAETKWQANLAMRRVKEAEKLAVRGGVDADVRARLESNFEAHAERVASRVEQFMADGRNMAALEASSEFESSLKAHEAILARVELGSFSVKVSNFANKMANARARAENNFAIGISAGSNAKADMEAAAEAKFNAATRVVGEARNFIDRLDSSIDASLTANANAKLSAASDTLAEAKLRLDAKAHNEAFVLSQEAIRLAQEARLLANAGATINIGMLDVGAGGKVEVNTRAETETNTGTSGENQTNGENESGSDIQVDVNGSGSGGIQVEF